MTQGDPGGPRRTEKNPGRPRKTQEAPGGADGLHKPAEALSWKPIEQRSTLSSCSYSKLSSGRCSCFHSK